MSVCAGPGSRDREAHLYGHGSAETLVRGLAEIVLKYSNGTRWPYSAISRRFPSL